VTLHLGNGCSACAIRDGRSVDTSMGFTPLEGLLMGTRSGDLDPSVVVYLAERERTTPRAIESLLNERSGLLGLSGRSRDMRDLLQAEAEGDERARLAIDVFCYRARKYVGAYFVALGGADAVIFTAGIGENSAEVRQRICGGLECIGVAVDPERNAVAVGGVAGEIGVAGSRLPAWVIPTDEERLIARDTFAVVSDPGAASRSSPG
jgi:acetate kinase